MPEINIQSVSSCSSEDKKNPAENLLKDGGTYKWKSANIGEKSASVVLKLGEASQIHSIDIGNEGSAFIEVLVGKEFDSNFEVLLVASSFMTPLESRNGTNRNGVRMFGPEKLNKTTSEKKWDRVKIVCTQPFCKTYTYGLSFIKFHSPPKRSDTSQPKVQKLGHFTIKDDDDSDDIPVGSLFASRSKDDPGSHSSIPSGAAAIRAAAREAENSPVPSSFTPAKESRKRLSDSPPNSSQTPSKIVKKGNTDSEEEAPSSSKPTLKRKSSSLSSTTSTASSAKLEKSDLKRTKTEPVSKSPAKAFSKLMEKVTFVLSGFQNPFRGELRDKAFEMGAKYKSDWGRGCTHLICAFANTPKYKQVSGKGKIVTKSWILDSHKQKRLMPWRKYRLGDAESPDESSEEENEVVEQPAQQRHNPEKKETPKPEGKKHQTKAAASRIKYSDDEEEEEEDSGGDTEDELLKAKELAQKKKGESKTPENNAKDTQAADPYGDSTDEDESAVSISKPTPTTAFDEEGSDSGFPDLPDFFTDKNFFFYGDFSTSEQRLLTRYIYAYNGEVEDYMSKRVKYVITAQKWDDNFDEALNENPDLIFVKPKWIYTCHEKTKLVPYQPHIVVL